MPEAFSSFFAPNLCKWQHCPLSQNPGRYLCFLTAAASTLSGALPGLAVLEYTSGPLSVSHVQALHIFIHSIHRTVLKNRCYHDHPYFADTKSEAQKDELIQDYMRGKAGINHYAICHTVSIVILITFCCLPPLLLD